MGRSFFQSVCVLGYCLFPLTIAALINVFVHTIIVRLPVIAVTYIWSAFGKYPICSVPTAFLPLRECLLSPFERIIWGICLPSPAPFFHLRM